MKELSIEEKAKRYDEALARMSRAFNSNRCTLGFMNEIFPELKKSEDEIVIAALKSGINGLLKKEYHLKGIGGISFDRINAWLEKQGGHAKFINGIKVGDKVTRNEDGVLVNLSQLNRVANKQGEQKLLYVNDNAKEMFIKALERVEEQNAKGYKLTDCDKNSWWEDFKNYTSCTVEQNPAWSEEDEKIMNTTLCVISDFRNVYKDSKEAQKDAGKIEDWLNSLKDRYAWKPSDEQTDALRYVTNFDYGGHKATLVSLYEQLKKLKG